MDLLFNWTRLRKLRGLVNTVDGNWQLAEATQDGVMETAMLLQQSLSSIVNAR